MATNYLDTSGLIELLKKLKSKFATKADSSTVTTLQSQVSTNTTDISSLKTDVAKKANSADVYTRDETYSQEQVNAMALGCTVHTEGGRTYATVEDMESGDTTELVAGDRCFITADKSVHIWNGAQWVLALDNNNGYTKKEVDGNFVSTGDIVQTTGTATDKVMSQKSVTDYVNQRLMDSTQSHTSFGSGFCYRLNARQIELLEASDVITLEICGQQNGGLNSYNNTAGMCYFDIIFGNNHARFRTTNDGAYAFTGDNKLNPLSGTGWQLAATQTGVEARMPNDRVLMVIDRKQGIVRLYDKCSRKIIECQRDAYKCDSWLQGDDWLAIMTDAKYGYVADLWALRIYDRDVTVLQYDNSFRVKDAYMTEAILPFQRPIIAKTIDVNDWVKEKFDKATQDKDYGRPYHFTKTYSYDPDDGLLTGTNDTSDWVMIGPGSSGAGNLYGIIDVDFEVTGGNWRVAKKIAIKVYAITKADGTDMGIKGIMGSDRTELEAGRYTMSYISFSANAFCDIAPGATIKMHSMHQHTLHCVANINPRYYCNMQCWDDARQEWWTPLNVDNHSTPVVPTFSDAAWRSVPAPALLSQPSFNGQLKVDDSGKVYVGVVVGATRTWKQINNT